MKRFLHSAAATISCALSALIVSAGVMAWASPGQLVTIIDALNHAATVTAGGALNVAVNSPTAAARHFPGCTVGATSGQCLAAGTAVNFVQIQDTSTTNAVACAWGVPAVLNSSSSVQLAVGQGASWGPDTAGVPSGALNCIAAGSSTPLYLEWN